MSSKKMEMRIARLETQVAHLERSAGDMDYLVQVVEHTLGAAAALREVVGCSGGWPVNPKEHFEMADTMIGAAKDDLQCYFDASGATVKALIDGDKIAQTMLMFKPDILRSNGIGTSLSTDEFTVLPFGNTAPEDQEWFLRIAIIVWLTEGEAKDLYAQHTGKDFYDGLISFTLSGPVCVTIWSGEEAWRTGREKGAAVRKRLNCEDPAVTGPENAIHGSDSPEAAEREVKWATRIILSRQKAKELA